MPAASGGRYGRSFRRSPLSPLEIITGLRMQVEGGTSFVESMKHGKRALTSNLVGRVAKSVLLDVFTLTHSPAQVRSGSRAFGELRCFPFSSQQAPPPKSDGKGSSKRRRVVTVCL